MQRSSRGRPEILLPCGSLTMKWKKASDSNPEGLNGILASIRCHPRPFRALWVFRLYGTLILEGADAGYPLPGPK